MAESTHPTVMRTAIVIVAGACVAFGVTYVIVRPRQAEPAKPMTLAGIQQRREAGREIDPARSIGATPVNTSVTTVSTEPIGHFADSMEQLDRSMVGLPFEMFESVIRQCRRWHDCEDMDTFLRRMAAEPRDPDWAPQIEQYIVKALAIEEEGALRVRALECRATRCALEVASEAQQYGIQKTWHVGDLDLISIGPSAYGSEPDPGTGLVTYVNVHTWRRKTASDNDE